MAITNISSSGVLGFNDTTGAVQLPSGTTAQRPGSPSNGEMRFNTDTSQTEYYDGATWVELALVPPPTYYWIFVGDAGGQITSVRMNADTGDFTYSVPSGYSQWSQGSTVNFDANNTYGGEVSIQESGALFTKTSSNFYNAAWSGTSRAVGGGKFYLELEFLNADLQYGITKNSTAQSLIVPANLNESITFYSYSTNYNNYGTVTSGSSTLTNNDVVGMRIDLDNNILDVYKNNSAFLTGITIAN